MRLAEANLASTSAFVSTFGTHLVVNGQPWRFLGYNMYQIVSFPGGHTCGRALSDAEVDQVLDRWRSTDGAAVVRTWFFQAYGGPGNWSDFDRIVHKAATRGIRVVPTLINQWGDCEPLPDGTTHHLTLPWYQGGYQQPYNGNPLSFRDYAVAVAAHYANNPTIAFWQLVNEANATSQDGTCDEHAAAAAMRNFADDMSAALKRVDPHHLVSLGTSGGGQCGANGDDYRYVHAGAIDICEIHDYYPPAPALGGDPLNGQQTRIKQCTALGKPIFVGEAGFAANVQEDGTSAGPITTETLARRSANFSARVAAYFAAGASGLLVWQYGDGQLSGDVLVVAPGDPMEAAMRRIQTSLPTVVPG